MFPEREAEAAEVRRAARRLIRQLEVRIEADTERLGQFAPSGELVPRFATHLVQMQIAQLALAAPTMSLGTCGIDGTPLRFIGRTEGLFVCCTADPQHCWNMAGEPDE